MSVLARRAAATPDRTALVDADSGRTWGYGDLDVLVDRAAERLREHAPGADRVGTLSAPGPAFVVGFHAVRRLDRTVVGLDTRLTDDELRSRIGRADVDVLVHGPGVTVPGSVGTPTLAGETLVDGGCVTETDTPDGTAPTPGVRPPEADQTAVILFTSGTTGSPKAVRLTAGNLHASAVASALRLGVSPDDRWLDCLPVSHVGGLAPVVRTALYGTTLVVQCSSDTGRVARALEQNRLTGISLVPAQLRRLLDADAPLSDLEAVLVGGAPTPEPLLERALAAGVSVYPTYGLTEAASQVATARPEQARARPGTVGQPLYGVRVTVVADGQPAPPGNRGELVVDGPTVGPGYLDTEQTAAAFGEWGLHTGDVGYRDESGRLWVVGRRDDLLLTGGELVAPEAVVEAIQTHPAVSDAAVVGLDDEEWGQRVAALVVSDGELDAATVREHCRASLADYSCPQTVAFADTIPRTVSGTVDRAAVRTLLRERGRSV